MTGVVLGVDPGSRRVGVAVSDPSARIALPLTVIIRDDSNSYIEQLVELARAREAVELVVGLPRRLDGTDGAEADKARALARILHDRLEVAVHLVDERFTSRISQAALGSMNISARRQRGGSDKIAATVLLQGFLDSRRSRPQELEVH